jgi:hypothetical protein
MRTGLKSPSGIDEVKGRAFLRATLCDEPEFNPD